MVRRIVYPPAVCMLGNIHRQPIVGAAVMLVEGDAPNTSLHIMFFSCTSTQFGHKWFKKI